LSIDHGDTIKENVFTMLFPKVIIKKVLPARNGPKGITLFIFFFFNTIKAIPMTEPIAEAINKAKNDFSSPKRIPINKTNLTSPNPSHVPFEIKKSKKKKLKSNNPETRKLIKNNHDDPEEEIKKLNSKVTTMAGKRTASGIM
jgi:hypothetical protein